MNGLGKLCDYYSVLKVSKRSVVGDFWRSTSDRINILTFEVLTGII